MSTIYQPTDRPPCHPAHPEECPVFMPGDKVRERLKYHCGPVLRIVERTAYYGDEIITFRDVETGAEITCMASDIVRRLEMVAMGVKS